MLPGHDPRAGRRTVVPALDLVGQRKAGAQRRRAHRPSDIASALARSALCEYRARTPSPSRALSQSVRGPGARTQGGSRGPGRALPPRTAPRACRRARARRWAPPSEPLAPPSGARRARAAARTTHGARARRSSTPVLGRRTCRAIAAMRRHREVGLTAIARLGGAVGGVGKTCALHSHVPFVQRTALVSTLGQRAVVLARAAMAWIGRQIDARVSASDRSRLARNCAVTCIRVRPCRIGFADRLIRPERERPVSRHPRRRARECRSRTRRRE